MVWLYIDWSIFTNEEKDFPYIVMPCQVNQLNRKRKALNESIQVYSSSITFFFLANKDTRGTSLDTWDVFWPNKLFKQSFLLGKFFSSFNKIYESTVSPSKIIFRVLFAYCKFD